jgi:hypothetical protein
LTELAESISEGDGSDLAPGLARCIRYEDPSLRKNIGPTVPEVFTQIEILGFLLACVDKVMTAHFISTVPEAVGTRIDPVHHQSSGWMSLPILFDPKCDCVAISPSHLGP